MDGINRHYFGYGYSTNGIAIVAHEDNALWSLDFHGSSGAGTGAESSVVYRIQGIDLTNGEKLFKKLVPHYLEVEGNSNRLVWVKIQDGLLGMDIFTGKTTRTINEKVLMEAIPQLSNGVYEYKYNSKTLLLDIVSKDDLKLSVDPSTLQRVENSLEANGSLRVREHSIYDGKDRKIIEFERNSEREKLIGKDGQEIVTDLFFLKGRFLAIDTLSQRIFTTSYETLDENRFLIRCVTPNGKLQWESNQDELEVGDFFERQPKFKSSFLYRDALIVVFDGFVFSLNPANGHRNWLTRI